MKLLLSLLLVAGCALPACLGCGSSSETHSHAASLPAGVDASQFLLAEEPDGAMGVIAARESAVDGQPLVLVGRIGGEANPWIDGRAAFTLLDASMSVVAEGMESTGNEICTGDCCALERLHCTTLVKVVDSAGQLVPVDARQLLGLQMSDMVVVEGTAQKDDSGNFVMLASGVYVRK